MNLKGALVRILAHALVFTLVLNLACPPWAMAVLTNNEFPVADEQGNVIKGATITIVPPGSELGAADNVQAEDDDNDGVVVLPFCQGGVLAADGDYTLHWEDGPDEGVVVTVKDCVATISETSAKWKWILVGVGLAVGLGVGLGVGLSDGDSDNDDDSGSGGSGGGTSSITAEDVAGATSVNVTTSSDADGHEGTLQVTNNNTFTVGGSGSSVTFTLNIAGTPVTLSGNLDTNGTFSTNGVLPLSFTGTGDSSIPVTFSGSFTEASPGVFTINGSLSVGGGDNDLPDSNGDTILQASQYTVTS